MCNEHEMYSVFDLFHGMHYNNHIMKQIFQKLIQLSRTAISNSNRNRSKIDVIEDRTPLIA